MTFTNRFLDFIQASGKKYLVYSLILAGLALSVTSYFGWCTTQGCSLLHGVRIFSLHLSIWGIFYFLLLGFLTFWAKSSLWHMLRRAFLAGGIGAEVTLIHIQWIMPGICFVCLAVGSVVLVLGIVELMEIWAMVRTRPSSKGATVLWRPAAAHTSLVVGALALGILLSLPAKDTLTASPTITTGETALVPGIGKKEGYPVMRIYSDYFCPTCRLQEPVINSVIDKVIGKARIVFCDLPTQGAISRKYIAYFIAGLINDNDDQNLLRARESLFELAAENVQAGQQLQNTLQACGLNLNFDGQAIDRCFREIRALALQDGVTSTPTVVIESKNGQKQVFKADFNSEELLAALGKADNNN